MVWESSKRTYYIRTYLRFQTPKSIVCMYIFNRKKITYLALFKQLKGPFNPWTAGSIFSSGTTTSSIKIMPVKVKIRQIYVVLMYLFTSMTSLLTHTVAHSTRPSFRLKTNNQPLKKFLSLAVSWVKVVKDGKILTFKVNFLCKKLYESF